ncbi:MAG: hypothetical protein J6Y72_08520 [Bacteroidales bacterium]|nr:hypothetical protein [Bacteroidales bacterium]
MKTQNVKFEMEFIAMPMVFSELDMNEIRGGRNVNDYMECGEHHDGSESTQKLLALV